MAEVKVVVRDRADGKSEVSVYDPVSGRDLRTGHVVAGSQREETIHKVKEIMERAGNHVQVKEMGN